LSATVPHLPVHVAVVELRAQPHTLGVVAPQAWPAPVPQTAVPHVTVPPHPSGIVPQLLPAGQADAVFGVHPHAPGVPPPPHVCGEVHVPQLSVPPHPSSALPHFCPAAQACAGKKGAQPHTLATAGLPPPQLWGGLHPAAEPQV
jgi:hypothetical protein